MYNLERGDLDKLAKASGIPRTTVRRYVLGGEVRASAAKAIDAAWPKLKPAKSAKKAAPKRRVTSGTTGGSKRAASPVKTASKTRAAA